ncbi:macrophage mannose receptor 1-like protein [Leptotrombidium deliense]|uniref:Macrophage mannose receptor 1-like protein n=1 Tax=Leptotrombidium deliense TaxID=299467 RepID=A0A443S5G1_9ACAR|nr:macrophage mannose receptor 1-like protein [Leptotrombidium deliense]
MVTIQDAVENRFISSLVGRVRNSRFLCYWLGGLQVAQTMKNFAWIDGKSVNFTNFGAHDPNNYDDDEDCVMLSMRANGLGEWWDEHCSVLNRQLCQKYSDSNDEEINFSDQFSIHFVDTLARNEIKVQSALKEVRKTIAKMDRNLPYDIDTISLSITYGLSEKAKLLKDSIRKNWVKVNLTTTKINSTISIFAAKLEKKMIHHKDWVYSLNKTFDEINFDVIELTSDIETIQYLFDIDQRHVEKMTNNTLRKVSVLNIEQKYLMKIFNDKLLMRKSLFEIFKKRLTNVTKNEDNFFGSNKLQINQTEQITYEAFEEIEAELNKVETKATIIVAVAYLFTVFALFVSIDFTQLFCRKQKVIQSSSSFVNEGFSEY